MTKKLLLHTCCAPCLTGVEARLKEDNELNQFETIDIFWFNPNIFPFEEWKKRKNEVKRYCKIIDRNFLTEYDYDEDIWLHHIQGFEDQPEGGLRCNKCFDYRLKTTAEFAKKNGYTHFGTTLTISPHKNAEKINTIGRKIANDYDIDFLNYDFKKKNGYLISKNICREYDIYRQNYCGCRFSIS